MSEGQTEDNDKAEDTRAIAASSFDVLPDDALIHVMSWLKMQDMVSAFQVNTRWRQIALSTASLWRDVQLTGQDIGTITHSAIIATRAKDIPIDVNITLNRMLYPNTILPDPLRKSAQYFLRQHGHHIAALEFNFEVVNCDSKSCFIADIPIFENAAKSGKRAGVKHTPYWAIRKHASIRFADLRTMRSVELRDGILPCAFRFDSVTEVRLLDFEEIGRETLDQVCAMFPNMTSLEIASPGVSFFDQEGAMEYFIQHMGRVEKLSIVTWLLYSQIQSVVGVLRWPVRTLEFNVSSSGNGFARQSRSVLRELLTADSILTIHSNRERDTTGEWKPKYFITIRVGSGAGREYTFIHDNFTRAAQNYIAPLLREKQIQEVVVDGHAACALFYVACGTTDLAHITTLRIVASDPDSIRAPQRPLKLGGLKELVLEKDPARGSRVNAATVEGLVSKLHTNGRVPLRIKDVYVYADGDSLNIEQYVNLVEGVVRPPSWCHIIPSAL